MNPAQGRKVALAFIVAVPVLAVADVVQFLSVEGVVNSHRRLALSSRMLAESAEIGTALPEAEASVREFSAGRDPKALSSFQTASADAKESVQQLVKLTEGNAQLQVRARKLEPMVTQTLGLLQKTIDLQSQAPAPLGKQTALEAQGAEQMTDVATALADFRKGEIEKLPARTSQAASAIERATVLTPLVAALGLWLVLLAALLLYRDARARTWSGIERRLHTRVVELLPIALCLVDDVGLIFYTNSSADVLFGYEPGGLVGRHVTALHNSREEGNQFFEEVLSSLSVKGTWTGKFASHKKNGAGFTCRVHAADMDVPGKVYRLFLYEEASEGV